MGYKSVIGSTLALLGKIEKRLGHLEEHLSGKGLARFLGKFPARFQHSP